MRKRQTASIRTGAVHSPASRGTSSTDALPCWRATTGCSSLVALPCERTTTMQSAAAASRSSRSGRSPSVAGATTKTVSRRPGSSRAPAPSTTTAGRRSKSCRSCSQASRMRSRARRPARPAPPRSPRNGQCPSRARRPPCSTRTGPPRRDLHRPEPGDRPQDCAGHAGSRAARRADDRDQSHPALPVLRGGPRRQMLMILWCFHDRPLCRRRAAPRAPRTAAVRHPGAPARRGRPRPASPGPAAGRPRCRLRRGTLG